MTLLLLQIDLCPFTSPVASLPNRCVAGCCLIPFFIDHLKSVQHQCPQCQAHIHTYRPFWHGGYLSFGPCDPQTFVLDWPFPVVSCLGPGRRSFLPSATINVVVVDVVSNFNLWARMLKDLTQSSCKKIHNLFAIFKKLLKHFHILLFIWMSCFVSVLTGHQILEICLDSCTDNSSQNIFGNVTTKSAV